jgi:hypothetical protein
MEPTPLRGHKIGAILVAGIGSTAFPIYRRGAAHAQGVGPLIKSVAYVYSQKQIVE